MTQDQHTDSPRTLERRDRAGEAPGRARRRVWRSGTVLLAMSVSLAYLGCAQPPEEAPPDAQSDPEIQVSPWFEEVARARGLDFVQVSGHREGRFWLPEIMGGGAALADVDGDGDLDAYLVQSGHLTEPDAGQPPNRLYLNRGDGHFEDVTAGSGAEARGYGMGVAAGDYDDDGDVDLYVTNLGPDVLLRNDGTGHFEDVTESAGLGHPAWGCSVAFLDYDRDGDLDLFVVNYLGWSPGAELDCVNTFGLPEFCGPQSYASPMTDVLYRNDGDGRFTDVSAASGFDLVAGNGLGVACADFDGNGWLDIFVANDQDMDRLWMNEGGSFEERAMVAGCAVDINGRTKSCMGIAIGDVDDDGDPDFLVGAMHKQTDSYFRNEGGYFQDVTTTGGLSYKTSPFTRFGMGWQDFDNDTYLDFYEANGKVEVLGTSFIEEDAYAEPNLVFRGGPGGVFEEIKPRGGTAQPVVATTRAAAFGDIDDDGGVDVLMVNYDGPVHLLRNVVPQRGHWIAFRVVLESGRDALGASVTLRLGERTLTRDVRAAYSYLSSSDPRVHFGLGEAAEAKSVTVRWPDGTLETFGDFTADRFVTLERGTGIGEPSSEPHSR